MQIDLTRKKNKGQSNCIVQDCRVHNIQTPSGDKRVLTGTAILASCLCLSISNTGRKDFELLT